MATALRAAVGNVAAPRALRSSSAVKAVSSAQVAASPFLGSKGKLFTQSSGQQQSVVVLQRRRIHGVRALQRGDYYVKEDGKPESLEYRVYFADKEGNTISPWHDIPLKAGDGLYNFIVEIPKETSAKMEVATDEPNTPIKQDTKKGKLRFYPYNINWNYGLLPQTWEDPTHANTEIEGCLGDNDPVDVVEIGERQAKIGEVMKVKPLAVLAMIDEGELDWKVVAISVDDPKAKLVNTMEDVEKHFPGTLTAIRNWFRDYKIPDGKPANRFGLDNKPADQEYALKVIAETNNAWANLVKSKGKQLVTHHRRLLHLRALCEENLEDWRRIKPQ
ncbi:inorganic pyrophosphatase [Marchantia polymorpha subsp. ruderalis]|uniref:inorganic diphosphatase n=1 Tax=Marchantia polymorpha TaxID=3197 RepID=A0A2R6XMW9_MARPO|nr:hypothetical protein MARPO_0008s0217 [Marchantia polymorpha]BBN19362.1 hypothetical protein Mp_8g10050 [Marchantia polymorpha subsp. ruderalis]|eukprot:PTQ47470.1 hypothetical protein MARPO_0008s0217 [Marchantia polymorpha]